MDRDVPPRAVPPLSVEYRKWPRGQERGKGSEKTPLLLDSVTHAPCLVTSTGGSGWREKQMVSGRGSRVSGTFVPVRTVMPRSVPHTSASSPSGPAVVPGGLSIAHLMGRAGTSCGSQGAACGSHPALLPEASALQEFQLCGCLEHSRDIPEFLDGAKDLPCYCPAENKVQRAQVPRRESFPDVSTAQGTECSPH